MILKLFLVTLLAAGFAHGSETYSLTVLHVNDTHSNLEPAGLQLVCPGDSAARTVSAGSAAGIAGALNAARDAFENVLFLHAGDMVQGTLFYTVYGGRADAAVYNALMPDAMVTGNHEFDRGSPGLAFLLDLVDFPVICANLDVSSDTLLAGRIPAFIAVPRGGELIGIVGVVTDEIHAISSPSNDTVVLPGAAAVQNTIDQLQEMGINKIVVLSHTGYENDLRLASRLSGADIIVGGHSHTLLGDFQQIGLHPQGEYPAVVEGADGETVLVVQAWRYGQVLGRLSVDFDREGRIVGYSGSPVVIAVGEVPGCFIEHPMVAVPVEDAFVQEIVDVYAEAIGDFEAEVAAVAVEELPHTRVPGEQLPTGSMIAPIVADAMLWKVNALGTGADFALQNAGGVRISIPAGEITVGDVYRLLPFGNTLSVMDITGEEMRQVLEGALAAIFDRGLSDGAFPYVSGLQYAAEIHGEPGRRITGLQVAGDDGSFSDVEADSTYTLVTNAFVAGGGDGYQLFAGKPFTDTGFTDSEVFLDFIRQLGTVGSVPQRVFLR
jgi:5'-nucleotidase / UDP-sugar diphosphatase